MAKIDHETFTRLLLRSKALTAETGRMTHSNTQQNHRVVTILAASLMAGFGLALGCGADAGPPSSDVPPGTVDGGTIAVTDASSGGADASVTIAVTDGSSGGADGSSGGADASSGGADTSSGGADASVAAEGVEGSIADGATVRITPLSGETFGEQGPPIHQVFDRFAGKHSSDARDESTPDIGAFTLYGYKFAAAPHTDYVDEEFLSDGASYQAFLQGTQGASLAANRLQLTAPEKVREVFMSANLLVPEGGWGPPSEYVDDEGWPQNSYAKIFWVEDGAKGGTDGGAWDMLGAGILGDRLSAPSSGNEPLLNGRPGMEQAEFPAWPTDRGRSLRDVFKYRRWHLLQYGFQAPAATYGPTPSAFRRMTVQDDNTVYAERDTSSTYVPFVEGVTPNFDSVAVPAYIRPQERETPASERRHLYLDDVYIALGTGAMCRVELHDVEDDAQAKVVAVSPVLAGDWKAGEITVTLRFNRYVPASPVGFWLKVYGPDGNRLTARRISDI